MIRIILGFILLIFFDSNQVFSQEKFIPQDYSVVADTVVIDGYIVSFIESIYFEKNKNAILIDYIDGTRFLTKAEFCSKRKIFLSDIDTFKRRRDSIILTNFDNDFSTFNYWFFNRKLPNNYNIDFSPQKKKYSKKDYRYHYNYFYVKAKCVKIDLPIASNQKLLRFFFNFSEKQLQGEKLPVYTIIEIQDYKYLK